MRYGALPEEWQHWVSLGLTTELLPVVSNKNYPLSPHTTLTSIGKVPSVLNQHKQIVGLNKWPERQSTATEIERWKGVEHYGICLQTRIVRALDFDITDRDTAIEAHVALAHLGLPCRMRKNADKFLVLFVMPGDYTKRIIRTGHGIIEFLATGQQFIANGTHTSGARYEWQGGLPEEIPTLTPDEFETLWSALQSKFGTEDSIEVKATQRKEILNATVHADPVVNRLHNLGLVLDVARDGTHHIVCPFVRDHTTEGGTSSTSYFPAHTHGYATGNFSCLHAHCAGRSRAEFLHAIGIDDRDDAAFEPIITGGDAVQRAPTTTPSVDGPADDEGFTPGTVDSAADTGLPAKPTHGVRFKILSAAEVRQIKPPSWIIKGVLPRATLGVIFGGWSSGKSFWTLDLACSIVEGTPFFGHPVTQGNVLYVVGEGSGGFGNRLLAYEATHGTTLDRLKLLMAAPNFMERADVKDLLEAIRPHGRQDVIIIDTLAQSMSGGNENSSEDVGAVLANCRRLHEATGALILLVHHVGKDSLKGARGHSSLSGAADVMIEVEALDRARSATIVKMKDGEMGEVFGFELQTVTLDEDDDGEPITSCVIEPTGKQRVVAKRQDKLGDKQKMVLNLVRSSIGLGTGETTKEQILEGYKAKVDQTGKRDVRAQHLNRALLVLENRGLLKIAGEKITLPEAENTTEELA